MILLMHRPMQAPTGKDCRVTLLQDPDDTVSYYAVPKDKIAETLRLNAYESIELGLDSTLSKTTVGKWLVYVVVTAYWCIAFLLLGSPASALAFTIGVLLTHVGQVLYSAWTEYRRSREQFGYYLDKDQSLRLEDIQHHLVVEADHPIWQKLEEAVSFEIEKLGQPRYMTRLALHSLLKPDSGHQANIKERVDNYIFECRMPYRNSTEWGELASKTANEIGDVVAMEAQSQVRLLNEVLGRINDSSSGDSPDPKTP